MLQIENREQFEKWLEDKPAEWAQALALHSALRVLPIALDPDMFQKHAVPSELTAAVIRAIIISWAAQSCPDHDMVANAAAAAAFSVANAAATVFVDADRSAADAATHAAFAAVNAVADAAGSAAEAVRAAADAADAVRSADDTNPTTARNIWERVNADCFSLESEQGSAKKEALALLAQPLWKGATLSPIIFIWKRAYQTLAIDSRFWIKWIDRRFAGRPQGFDLPTKHDMKIQICLLDQNDEWWQRGLGPVTADIKAWIIEQWGQIDGANKSRFTEDYPVSLYDINIVPQIRSAPTFRSTENYKLSINFDQDSDELRTDQEAADRHSELRAELHLLKEQCQGSNSLGHVVNLVDRLLEALGPEVREMRTSLVVQRGERIRQLVATYEHLSPASLHEKVDEFVFNQLKATRDALNMVIGLDPVLDNLDRARLGPDVQMSMVSPSEVKERFDDLAAQDIITPETEEFVEEAVILAPTVPDPENRQSRTVDLLAQNFVRYSIELIAQYPDESAWAALFTGLGAAGLVGPVAVLTATFGGIPIAYFLGRNILANQEFYRTAVGSSPANQANFEKLLTFLQKGPLKSLKDED